MHPLNHPSLAVSNRQDIIAQFFDSNAAKTQENTSEDESYFEYFEDQCELAHQNDDFKNQICTRQNICSIIHQIKAGTDRATLKYNLSSNLDIPQKDLEDALNNVTDLAVRLYLIVFTGEVRRGVTGQSPIVWKEGSLKNTIAKRFQHQLILTDSVKFEKLFNAKNVERTADVTIQWTPNLVDHLRFSEDGKKPVLNIFHHARFLEFHRER